MKLKWIGQSCFLITSEKGLRIIMDPYENQMGLRWEDLDEVSDIVTVSHEHFDHNNVAAIKGNPKVLREDMEIKGTKFRVLLTEHGAGMGENRLFCIQIDGIDICHCGDLGHVVTDKQKRKIGNVDVLMVPVGGTYTLDGESATRLYEKLNPSLVLPMHYSCEKMASDVIEPLDRFLKGKKNITVIDNSEIEVIKENLSAEPQILLMKSQN